MLLKTIIPLKKFLLTQQSFIIIDLCPNFQRFSQKKLYG